MVGQFDRGRLSDEDTANFGVIVGLELNAAIPAHACAHLAQRGGAVRLALDLPGLGDLWRGEAAEEPATDDPVVGMVRLEEERLAHGQSAKGAIAGRAPEVDLVGVGQAGRRPHARCTVPTAPRQVGPGAQPSSAGGRASESDPTIGPLLTLHTCTTWA